MNNNAKCREQRTRSQHCVADGGLNACGVYPECSEWALRTKSAKHTPLLSPLGKGGLRGVRFALFPLYFSVVLLLGCALLNPSVDELGELKALWQNGEYTQIAEREITCEPSDEGCNQQHLIKGDACYRLGKLASEGAQSDAARALYDCAATHLSLGIAQTTDWQLGDLNLNRAQTYENLCEALRQWQDLETGETALQLAQRLLEIAQAFLVAEPGNLAAIYFSNSARLSLILPRIIRGEDSAALCDELNQMLQSLQAAGADGTRYAANYQQLESDIRGIKGTLGVNCP